MTPGPIHDERKEREEDLEARKTLQSIVGKFLWLTTKTRPDIGFATNVLCRHIATAGEPELVMGKRVLRYLAGTRTMGTVFYNPQSELQLSGASDSDLAGDQATSKSTTGHFLNLGLLGMVCGGSRLQRN